jgi:UDP-glucose:(heptosyl)LPS alpha-1,3-glucosyltransferase
MKSVTLLKAELFKQGGLEKYTWALARDFCALGSPVTVLTTGNVQSPFSDPLLNIVSFPIAHPLSFFNVVHFEKACIRYLERNPTPVVFGLDRNSFQTHIRAGNGAHIAYLKRRAREEGYIKQLSFAVNPLHRAILSLEKKGFEHPELKILFTNSEMVKNEILQFYSLDPRKIEVVHNGVDWHAMQKIFDRWETIKEQTVQDRKAFQFLFVGHNFFRKGLEKLLFALAQIKEEHFQLNVVGHERNADYFKNLAQKLNISQKVFFFGPQKEMAPFYSSADCLAIPSLYDPFANVTVEALAMGLFVLSSKTNGGHEVLNEKNGVVIESLDDVKRFAEELKNTLNFRKTGVSAHSIRQSVRHLDFSSQLRRITALTIGL